MTFTADWFSNNLGHLPGLLKHLRGKPNLCFLEIGCYEGRSTLWFLENILTHPSSGIDCIDSFAGGHDLQGQDFSKVESAFRANTSTHGGRLRLFKGESGSVLAGMHLSVFANHYDLIYVDGDHIAPGVLQDMVLSWPMLKRGGIMMLDDYEWPGHDGIRLNTPKPGIDAFLEVYKQQFTELHRGYQIAIQKS